MKEGNPPKDKNSWQACHPVAHFFSRAGHGLTCAFIGHGSRALGLWTTNTFLRFRWTSDKKNISNRRGFIIHVLTTIFVLFEKLSRLNNIINCFKKNWQHRDNEDNRIIAIIINSRAFTPRINCKNVITPAGSSLRGGSGEEQLYQQVGTHSCVNSWQGSLVRGPWPTNSRMIRAVICQGSGVRPDTPARPTCSPTTQDLHPAASVDASYPESIPHSWTCHVTGRSSQRREVTVHKITETEGKVMAASLFLLSLSHRFSIFNITRRCIKWEQRWRWSR